MRPSIIAILTFSFLSSVAQPRQGKVFKNIDYVNGNFYRQLYDTIRGVNKKVDIYFLQRHFYLPYYLPEKLIDKHKRNQRVSVWSDPRKKNPESNRENTYTYNSLGRMINFTYSSCVSCSSLSYNYLVKYNSKGQVERIFDTNAKDSFKFYYDSKGEVVKFEKYLADKLETVIALMK